MGALRLGIYMNEQGVGFSSGICGRMYSGMIGGDCFGVKNFEIFRGSQHKSVNTIHNDNS